MLVSRPRVSIEPLSHVDSGFNANTWSYLFWKIPPEARVTGHVKISLSLLPSPPKPRSQTRGQGPGIESGFLQGHGARVCEPSIRTPKTFTAKK